MYRDVVAAGAAFAIADVAAVNTQAAMSVRKLRCISFPPENAAKKKNAGLASRRWSAEES
jgi:hypothetical protein